MPKREKLNALQRWVGACIAPLVAAGHQVRTLRFAKLPGRVRAQDGVVCRLDDDALRARALAEAARLRRRRSRHRLADLFATIREAIRRETGLLLNDRQLEGAAILWSGMVAEMDTGEGKTLTALLAAATAALTGRNVHIITVNDYLARRDHDLASPILRRLGVRPGLVLREMKPDARRAAYREAIVFVSNAEVAFDHLRDRSRNLETDSALVRHLGLGTGAAPLISRLDMAIVDEADSVLIDEARIPLLLSAEQESIFNAALCQVALNFAESLDQDADFTISAGTRNVEVDPDVVERFLGEAPPDIAESYWSSALFREELLRNALLALHHFKPDRDYLIEGGKVILIDPSTGRVHKDRRLSHGLHQMIEVKEAAEVSPDTAPMGRLTYQAFFRRYQSCCGLTGTVAEVSGELWRVYGLRTARIRTDRPSQRQMTPPKVSASRQEQETALVARVAELHTRDGAVLIGTRSVQASERLSAALRAAGLAHEVLNARAEAREARIIAEAGRAGQITVATNMAGRGVDIRPNADVLSEGGLTVILTEFYDARRIDRQMQGRTARRGDPGRCEAWLSLEDPILAEAALLPGPLLAGAVDVARRLPILRYPLLKAAQKRLEHRHRSLRWRLFLAEARLDDLLAVAGPRE